MGYMIQPGRHPTVFSNEIQAGPQAAVRRRDGRGPERHVSITKKDGWLCSLRGINAMQCGTVCNAKVKVMELEKKYIFTVKQKRYSGIDSQLRALVRICPDLQQRIQEQSKMNLCAPDNISGCGCLSFSFHLCSMLAILRGWRLPEPR